MNPNKKKGHDRTTGLISVPRAQQKQISWLGTLFLDSSKSSYPDFPVGETSCRSVRAGLAAAAEHSEQIRMSSHTSDSHRVSSSGGASAQRQDAGREWLGMELLRTKQARKQGWEANISSRTSRCVLIFFSLLLRSLNVIILPLPLFDCYLPLLVAMWKRQHMWDWTGSTAEMLSSTHNSHRRVLIPSTGGSANVEAKLHSK